MSPFYITTALPFGYLLTYGALLGLAALGVRWAAAGIRRRRPRRTAVGAALAVFAGYVLWVNQTEGEALDLSPRGAGPGQLAGRWAGAGGATLELSAAGTWRCTGGGECAEVGRAGTWVRDGDFDIALRPAGAPGEARYRVVRFRGRLRLAHPIDGDPDEWDGALPFEQVALNSRTDG